MTITTIDNYEHKEDNFVEVHSEFNTELQQLEVLVIKASGVEGKAQMLSFPFKEYNHQEVTSFVSQLKQILC